MPGFAASSLPTAYHWYRAAIRDERGSDSLSPAIVGASNFSGKGSSPRRRVRRHRPVGHLRHGRQRTRMALERVGDAAVDRGGAWNEVPYMFWNQIDSADPGTGRPSMAFAACARCRASRMSAANCSSRSSNHRSISRRSSRFADETYAVLAEQLSYVPSTPRASQRRAGRTRRTRCGGASGSHCRPATTTRALRSTCSCRPGGRRRTRPCSTYRTRGTRCVPSSLAEFDPARSRTAARLHPQVRACARSGRPRRHLRSPLAA